MKKGLIVVLFTGHCGSSWITSLLGNHENILQIGSEPIDQMNDEGFTDISDVFRGLLDGESPISDIKEEAKPYIVRNDDQDFERKYKEAKYLVLKTRSLHILQPEFFTDIIPQYAQYIILLRRRNKLKNAFSRFKRSVLGVSHLGTAQNAEAKKVPVKIVPWELQLQAVNYTRRDLIDLALFNHYRDKFSIPGEIICYEDMLDNEILNSTLNQISQKLHLKNDNLESKYKKVTSDSLSIAIRNYGALERKMKGSIFEGCLESDKYDPTMLVHDGHVSSRSIAISEEDLQKIKSI